MIRKASAVFLCNSQCNAAIPTKNGKTRWDAVFAVQNVAHRASNKDDANDVDDEDDNDCK